MEALNGSMHTVTTAAYLALAVTNSCKLFKTLHQVALTIKLFVVSINTSLLYVSLLVFKPLTVKSNLCKQSKNEA
jgi:hypothetical protein